jgi:hypothetical protein
MDGKYAYISYAVTEHSALLRLAYKFVSEELLIPANLENTFYIVKLKFSKCVTF